MWSKLINQDITEMTEMLDERMITCGIQKSYSCSDYESDTEKNSF